ncbi:MAG: BlaI/MecI/CopY family transcriptional regulator [Actinomycetota bacterium]|nr:BlaI/MecI/CopY family transcriptional regulator [Actinomycetota bacterium]
MARRSNTKETPALADIGLGELEAAVMKIIWEKNINTVKDVFIELYPKKRLAYTTIMTVMRRLAEKGVLEQDRTAKTYYYKAKVGQEEMAESMINSVVNKVLGNVSADVVIGIIKKYNFTLDELTMLEQKLAGAK